MSIIRKLSIGNNIKDAMHYVVGQSILNDTCKIHEIQKTEKLTYIVWIKTGDNSIIAWKEYNCNIPISIEFNIDF